MAAADKDTIYIDIDDEITGIIDKLRSSDSKLVALVLPKRASVFQSIVNMKLLKRAADDSKKNLVLITSEAGLLPLAGAAGVHVAQTLTSKPSIPLGPAVENLDEETIDEAGEVPDTPPDATAPIGELAGVAAAADGVETLELDDDPLPEAAAKPKDFTPPGKAKKGAKKDKKLKIPDFNRFRLLLIAGALVLILLIAGIIFAMIVLPKATINVKTDATNVNTDTDLVLSTSAKELNSDGNIVPAKLAQQQKTYSQQIATTGQKNKGNKASGSVSITNCGSSDATLPAGTGFSSNGNTYISQQTVTVPVSDFKGLNGPCRNNGKASVTVTAQSPGTAYNLPSGATFSIAGGPSGLSSQGDTIGGGSDNIVQVVNQADINNAKAKISNNDDTAKKSLESSLKSDDYYAIVPSFSAGTPSSSNSADVGDTASSVTVTETVTYTMFGAKDSDLKNLVDSAVKNQIDTSKQSILSEGLDKAAFTVNNATATSAQVNMQTVATAGPDLNTASITQDALGKKPGDITTKLKTNPDVTDVSVKLSPFWVSSVPKKESKVKVVIAKPTTTKTSSTNGNP